MSHVCPLGKRQALTNWGGPRGPIQLEQLLLNSFVARLAEQMREK